jgi:hypothetical protein
MLVVMAAGLAGAYNVLSDNSALQSRAAAEACAGVKAPCRADLARLMRSPFAQEFDFRVGRQTVRIRCTRSLVLVGDQTCARQP